MTKVPICTRCKHLIAGNSYTCKAFPDAIPQEILFGKNKHKEPLPGQVNQLVFEPLTTEEFHQRYSTRK